MSKNITIAEGTQARNFNNVHKLRTNLIGGGTQYWVPEDEAGDYANLSQKTITENGTYRASDEDKDGYLQVTVNVPPTRPNLTTKSITANGIYRGIDDGVDGFSQVNVNVDGVGEAVGTDSTDGNDYVITTDPQTGNLVKTALPSYIHITTLPTKTDYTVNENINISGIVVKAYKNDGSLWSDSTHSGGVIPVSELYFTPKKARLEELNLEASSELLDYSVAFARESLLWISSHAWPQEGGSTYHCLAGGKVIACFAKDNGTNYLIASDEPYTEERYDVWGDGSIHNYRTREINTPDIIYDGKPVYSSGFMTAGQYTNAPYNTAQFTGLSTPSEIPWTMLYGNVVSKYRQTINVYWNRPKDKKQLTDKFKVDVSQV